MITETEAYLGGPVAFWVLCEDPEGLRNPVLMDVPGLGPTLAVFSFEEEALLYRRLRGGAGPQAARVSRAELLALLVGRWADLGPSVALDPVPELREGTLLPLTTTGREDFVRFLVARRDGAVEGPWVREPAGGRA